METVPASDPIFPIQNCIHGAVAIGSYPPVEFPLPMTVARNGDIYLTKAERGLLRLKKVK